jgi:hypothetical protein
MGNLVGQGNREEAPLPYLEKDPYLEKETEIFQRWIS